MDQTLPHQRSETTTPPTQDGEDDDLITASDLVKVTRETSKPSKRLEQAVSACEEAIRGFGSIHSPEIPDRLKQAATLSILARCYLASRDRAQCERTCLKLAVCQVNSVSSSSVNTTQLIHLLLSLDHSGGDSITNRADNIY